MYVPSTVGRVPELHMIYNTTSHSTADPGVQDRDQLRYELDLNSWNLRIWGVAASGFLTDS
jgi:hypothetical protein